MKIDNCRTIIFTLLCSIWSMHAALAEIVWINDWDSPGEQRQWRGIVKVVSSEAAGYQIFRDLDGDGRHGRVNLEKAHITWGPQRVAAPDGHVFSNMVLRWEPVEHHKPCAAGWSMSVSLNGKFAGEEITATTPNSTGHSKLVINLDDKPQFRRVSQVFIRLHGQQNCGWTLGAGGIVLTADLLDAVTGRRVLPPETIHPHNRPLDGRRHQVDDSPGCLVSATTGLEINGYSRIEPEIFSLTAYEGAPDFDTKAGTKGVDFCSEYGIEGIGFPANMGWIMDGDWWNKMSIAEIDKWFDGGGAGELFRNYPAWTARYVYGRILPNLRKVGTRGFLYLYGPEPPFSDGDSRKWIHVSNRYIALCLKADPELRYLHLFGEPNARWFRRNVGVTEYCEFFNQWATETHKRFPRLKLGGPVTWGPPTRSVGWDDWCKTLLDESHTNLDFLDWHSYGHSADKLEADLHTVTGYGRVQHDKWIRNALSETNHPVGSRENWYDPATHFRGRAIPMMRQTFAFLRNPDKIFSRQFHDYAAWAGGYDARFIGNEKLPVTPMMLLYKAFKPLRGQRVLTRNPFPDIELEAAVWDRQLCVALANMGTETRRFPLRVDGLEKFQVTEMSARRLTVDGLIDDPLPKDLVIDLPAESLLVAVFKTEQPIQLTRSLHRSEYFSEHFMTRMGSIGRWQIDATIRLNDRVRRQADSATLRLGIARQEAVTGQNWEVDVDGQVFALSGDVPFCELRLPRVPSASTLPIRVTSLESPKTTYALSFASIVLSGRAKYASPQPVTQVRRQTFWSNDFGTKSQQREWAKFVQDDPRLDADGDQLAGTVRLFNAIGSTWGTERIVSPKGTRLSNLRVEWDVFRITPNGASWQIELSPDGRFAGEQVRGVVPPGVGSIKFTLDVSDDRRFTNLKHVYIRLGGTNGLIDWSSKAGLIKLLALAVKTGHE